MVKLKRIIGIIAYTLVFFLFFTGFSKALMHKQIEGRWNMTQKVAGFYNEDPNSFDVLFFGSSHIYCSVDPALFKEETGLDSYVFATQLQPIWISYHYLIEALKMQKPKTVVLEVNMLAQDPEKDYLDEATNHTAIDPIPFSRNKLDMIYAAVPKGERRYYFFHIMKYHDRWEDLEEKDFLRLYEHERDPDKGYVRLEEKVKEPVWEDVSDITEVKKGTGKSLEYIEKFIDYAKAEGIEVILLKAPSNATVEQKMYYNGAAEIAAERGITYLDFNTREAYEAMNLIVSEDFYDQMHLNSTGVKKFVKALGQKFNL